MQVRKRSDRGSNGTAMQFSRCRPLKKERELALAREARRGRHEALNQLVESNLGFAGREAARYCGMGMPFEDLLNEAAIGLIEAARRFDPDRNVKFITWAAWWIRKTLLCALSRQTRTVRVPPSQSKRLRQIRGAERDLCKELGRRPARGEIAARLSKSIAEVDRVLCRRVDFVHFDEQPGADDPVRPSRVPASMEHASIERELLDQEAAALVHEVYSFLSEQQQIVIRHRFGLHGETASTLREIGDLMGLSRERVRQIEVAATARMRRLMLRRIQPEPASAVRLVAAFRG